MDARRTWKTKIWSHLVFPGTLVLAFQLDQFIFVFRIGFHDWEKIVRNDFSGRLGENTLNGGYLFDGFWVAEGTFPGLWAVK